ncbi:Rz-like spanin [Pseudomonas phage AF]|uniref:Rz-like spanin n=1 Tax=Pseudomonas phage AF TaxID=1235689 RepID=UPI0002971ABC|nr:Rz-like spanin [Pseudomonas phage AF]AFV50637.1 putative Rz1-like protein [Pseudomonas phage AF]
MSKLRWLLILTMSLSAGCSVTPVVIDTSCTWVKPITTTAAERKVMTRQTKEEIAAHNDMWDLKCGKR